MVEALRKLASRSVEGLENLSDAEIVELCKKELPSDLTAYRELLRRYEGLVYNTCMKFIGSQQDAEEVAQDAMIQVFHKIHQFEGRSAFKTWLYKIVHNYCRNRVSKIIRKREVKESFEKHSAEMILVMKFTTGLTIQEIAEAMEIGLSAAKMRLYRALDSFKEIYNKKPTDSQSL